MTSNIILDFKSCLSRLNSPTRFNFAEIIDIRPVAIKCAYVIARKYGFSTIYLIGLKLKPVFDVTISIVKDASIL